MPKLPSNQKDIRTECGTEIDERADKPFHRLCMECFCKMYEQQAAVDFVRADEERLTDFLEYLYQDVQYRKFEYRSVISSASRFVEAVKILHPRMYTTFIDKVQDL